VSLSLDHNSLLIMLARGRGCINGLDTIQNRMSFCKS
jgi:hypothetical protein